MKVLFLQNIKGVAQIGDIKDIADGYARNFLLPRKLARAADASAIKQAEELKKKREAIEIKDKEAAIALIAALKDVRIEITEDASDEGHLYGSVSAHKIAEELKKQKNISVHDEDLRLPHNLKTVGEHEVTIEPFKGMIGTVMVAITKTKTSA